MGRLNRKQNGSSELPAKTNDSLAKHLPLLYMGGVCGLDRDHEYDDTHPSEKI